MVKNILNIKDQSFIPMVKDKNRLTTTDESTRVFTLGD